MQNRHHQLSLWLIVIFTVSQLVILFTFGYTPYPDSEGYLLFANDAVLHSEPYPVTTCLNQYDFLWNVGAINSVALSLYLFHSYVPLLILYSLMKGATAWFFYCVTKKITNQHIAFIALILYIIYPANYGEGTSLLSELPFMFFIMMGLYFSLVRNWFFFGGMMLAVANWFRPMAIVFLLALIIYYLLKWQKSGRLLIGYLVMILIIGSLSYYRTGLFLYQAKSGWMALTDYSTCHSPESMQIKERTDWNVAQKDSAWRSLFFDWLKDHPKEYISQMPRKLVNTYVSDNVNMCTFIPDKAKKEYLYEEVSLGTLIRCFPYYSLIQWLTLLNLFIYYVFLAMAFASLFYFKKENCLFAISVIVLGTLMLLFVGHGEARFHIPFMPFIMMLAAVFSSQKIWKG